MIGGHPIDDAAKPPVPGYNCGACKHWVASKRDECGFVGTPQGPQWVPIETVREEAMRAGQMGQFGAVPRATVSWCSFMPIWPIKAEHEWCGQWSPAIAVN